MYSFTVNILNIKPQGLPHFASPFWVLAELPLAQISSALRGAP